MAASIKDVAERAGVSIGPVSNVLNRPEKVAAATREQVLAAISELGFVRNSSAAQLRAGTSRSLGLIVLDLANPFFHDVARGVEDVAGGELAGASLTGQGHRRIAYFTGPLKIRQCADRLSGLRLAVSAAG